MKRVLRTGVLSGVVAGVTLGLFLATVGRGPIDAAIAIEHTAAGEGAVHEELFSRGVQQIGGVIGLLLYGVALGVVFAIVYTATAHRLPARTALMKAVQLGAIGFVTIVLVPFVKYPANPPAVGDPDTIDERTVQYLVVVAASIALTVLVFALAGRLRLGAIGRAWALTAAYAAGVVAILALMPANPDRVDVAADVVWEFRLASIGGLAVGWAALALTAGSLFTVELRAHRSATPDGAAAPGYADASP